MHGGGSVPSGLSIHNRPPSYDPRPMTHDPGEIVFVFVHGSKEGEAFSCADIYGSEVNPEGRVEANK